MRILCALSLAMSIIGCEHEKKTYVAWATPDLSKTPLWLEPDPVTGELSATLEATALSTPTTSLLTYGYNGGSPGPTLIAPLGTQLNVEVLNAMNAPTTVHWHGAGAPNEMDGTPRVQDPIAPGEGFRYQFGLESPGTFWYHPHFDTARQVDLGLYGMLIVYDPQEPQPDERLVLIFDSAEENQPRDTVEDHRHLDGHAMHWLINGQDQDTFSVGSGAVVRGHLLNASNAGYLQLSSPSMRILAHDQGHQGKVYSGPLILGPGDRAEVEWLPGSEPILVDNKPFSLNGGDTYKESETLFSLVPLGDAPPAEPQAWAERSSEDLNDLLEVSPDFTYVFHGDSRTNHWMLNGETYPNVTPFESAVGRQAIIEVRNLSATHHPFHMHGHPFQVIARNQELVDSRNLHDTINVGNYETLRLKVTFTRPGDWMVHCHILPHAYAGMMSFMNIEPNQ